MLYLSASFMRKLKSTHRACIVLAQPLLDTFTMEHMTAGNQKRLLAEIDLHETNSAGRLLKVAFLVSLTMSLSQIESLEFPHRFLTSGLLIILPLLRQQDNLAYEVLEIVPLEIRPKIRREVIPEEVTIRPESREHRVVDAV